LIYKTNCAICYENIKEDQLSDISWIEYPNIETPCKHIFHKLCLHKWINIPNNKYNNCPICRANIDEIGNYLNVVEPSANRIWTIHVNKPWWIPSRQLGLGTNLI